MPASPGAQAAQLVADLQFRRRVQRFERLGGYVLANLLAQLAVNHDCQDEIEEFLDFCAEREAALRGLGALQWPALSVRAVP